MTKPSKAWGGGGAWPRRGTSPLGSVAKSVSFLERVVLAQDDQPMYQYVTNMMLFKCCMAEKLDAPIEKFEFNNVSFMINVT